ncbi:hypothetical protein [Comamonas brasiliensis]|uniref:hypothetical protein n=1 Tax=Comamonas brasiliensis TaxID=1812482 RepID=UPI001B8B762E|nr:hypothetical protein [Comamonas sp. PE63]
MAKAQAMTVLSTQAPIQNLQRRRSADLASLRSSMASFPGAGEAMAQALPSRRGPRLQCSVFRSCLRLTAFKFLMFYS